MTASLDLSRRTVGEIPKTSDLLIVVFTVLVNPSLRRLYVLLYGSTADSHDTFFSEEPKAQGR